MILFILRKKERERENLEFSLADSFAKWPKPGAETSSELTIL